MWVPAPSPVAAAAAPHPAAVAYASCALLLISLLDGGGLCANGAGAQSVGRPEQV